MLRETSARCFVSFFASIALLAAAILTPATGLAAEIAWSSAERPIADKISELRSLPDRERGAATQSLALKIRHLPVTPNKLRLAIYLASMSTEGDFGAQTLHEVATTLEVSLSEKPIPWTEPKDSSGDPSSNERLPAGGYQELASLAQYEHVPVSLDDNHYRDAIARLALIDAERKEADFTLTDLSGHSWTLSQLHGKVVLINFWATWCPPCRKEIPDLDTLYRQFSSQGFVVLGISEDDALAKLEPFARQHPVSYPVLLDSNHTVSGLFNVRGIPKSFVFDRSGLLVAQAMDMRTQKQFLAMLREAGLQ